MHPLIKIIIEKRDLYHKKPKQIRSSLRDLMIPETYMPSKEQIGSFTATLRRKLVENFLKDNMDPIKKFVDDHSWNKAKKESDLICLESDLKYENFLLVVTSKALLWNVVKQERSHGESHFYTDATYKLLLNGFSVLTLGTENSNHNFRLIALAISAHENTSSFNRFFSRVKVSLQSYFSFNWKPNFMVSDAADSILLAIEKVFPTAQHFRCFFHAVKAAREKTIRWKDKNEKETLKGNWGYINYAMKLLHRTCSEEEFRSFWDLVSQDWKQKKLSDSFIKYFQKNFINNCQKQRWNRMLKFGFNLTNNSIERFHCDIKDTFAERKKLKLTEFLLKLSKMVRDYSIDHSDEFCLEHNIH